MINGSYVQQVAVHNLQHCQTTILSCFTFLSSGTPNTSVLIWSLTFISEQEWLLCRLRSGFGLEYYVTWYMGQNNSITYEIAVQGVTVVKGRLMQTAAVSVFSGCGSVLITDRRVPESSLSLFLLASFHFSYHISLCSPLFSLTLCYSVSYILFSQIS